eukprot:495367-Pyramimonas_sp.AAC.1
MPSLCALDSGGSSGTAALIAAAAPCRVLEMASPLDKFRSPSVSVSSFRACETLSAPFCVPL